MYNPDGGSRLYLISDSKKGIPLAPLVDAFNLLAPPIVESTWDGESGPAVPHFISPGRIIAMEDAAKERPIESRNTATGIIGSGFRVVNSGTIMGGLSGDNSTRADAIQFTGGTNSLEL